MIDIQTFLWVQGSGAYSAKLLTGIKHGSPV
jgi:hypothetical protein